MAIDEYHHRIAFLFPCWVWSCENQKGTSESTTNSPPVITSVSILPEKPKKESELNVMIQGQDPDGDPVIPLSVDEE